MLTKIWQGFGAQRVVWFSIAALTALAVPAHAHHVMGGKTPATFVEGLLGGLGHPILEPDHLAFILALGIAASLVPAGVGIIAAFVAASTAGVFAHVAKLNVPLIEPLVALSVIVAGAMLMVTRSGRTFGGALWMAFAAVAGLLHGYAFGEAIIGSEKGALGGYLIGLAAIATVIALGVRWAMHRWFLSDYGASTRVRLAGTALGVIGIVLLAGALGVTS